MDAVCGGDWWRQTWLAHGDDRDAAESAVVAEYARTLARAGGCGFWTTPVRNQAHHKPVYHLIFLTRKIEGLNVFGEALSLGLEKWRAALHDINDADSLFADPAMFKASEDALADGWVNEIEANLRRLLAGGEPFRVFNRYADLYGSAMGQAREKHLRAAWRRLYPHVTRTEPKGKLIEKLIEPA